MLKGFARVFSLSVKAIKMLYNNDCSEGKGGELMKRSDFVLIGVLVFLGLALLLGFKLVENQQRSGAVFAKVLYRDTLVLMIDLDHLTYKLYDTPYKDQIDVSRFEEGIFYVPGTTTTDMSDLYEEDDYAKDHQIVGIKLLVEDGKIRVLYQESPRDLCQLQRPTSSSLEPLVCLPNELVVTIMTNLSPDQFVPDGVLE